MNINCIVDVASREVSFQENYRIAAYDHNVDVIHFSVEPIEDFSLDLSSIKVAAQGPNKSRHDYAVDPATVAIEEETGYITFDWPIPQGVTEMPIGTFKYGDKGQLIFAVCAEIISGSTVSKAWHSDDGIITVVAHLEPESGGGEDPEEEATNAQKIAQLQTNVAVMGTQIGALANGSPTPVATVAEMTDESAVYLYTGSETGYTAGNWYYYNGTAWTSGGTYGGAVTSTTFTEHGVPADDFAVGKKFAEKADSSDVTALDTRVTSVDTELSVMGESGELYLKDFVQGNLDNNGELVSNNYFITTGNFHQYPYPIIFTPSDGYRYSVYWYNDGTYVDSRQLISVKKYCIPASTQFKLVIAKTTSATITPAEGYNKVSIKGYAGYYGWHNYNEIENLKNGRCLLPMVFNNGSDSAGTFAYYVNYRVTNVDLLHFDKDTVIGVKDGFKFGLHIFDSEGTYINDLGWKTKYTASPDYKYRFVIAKTTEDTSSIADLEEFYTAIYMLTPVGESIESVDINPLEFGFMQSGRAKLVAHTGYQGNGAPENTITAFEDAGKLGYWGIESDVNQTSDGHYVMIHDTTVDRTTNGSGSVSSMTLAEIRALHIKDHDDLKVPTLEEYLATCKHYGCVPIIELKSTITNTKASYETIIGIVDDYGLKDMCIFIGSKWAVSNFKQASDKIPFMPVYQRANNYNFDTEYDYVKGYPSVGMDWDFSADVSIAQARKLHGSKMIFGTFTVDTLANVKTAFLAGVDIVTTNNVLPTD